MINSISISGFKSIANTEPPIELGKVNVFIGANGSGKSNLLEAIGLLSDASDGVVTENQLRERGVRSSAPNLYRSSFHSVTVSPGIHLSADGVFASDKKIGLSVELDPPNKDAIQQWEPESITIKIPSKIDKQASIESVPNEAGDGLIRKIVFGKDHPSSLWLAAISEYAIFEPSTAVLRGLIPDPQQRAPVGLQGGRLAEAVGELFTDATQSIGNFNLDDVLELLDWVSAIDIVEPSKELLSPSIPSLRQVVRFTDTFMADGRNRLTGYDASEGALYVLFMLVLAMHPASPAFFAVENFDHALNPRLARRLVKIFADQILAASPDRQVLLTTHNPLVLDGLDLRNDMIRLFVVERDRSGTSQFHRIILNDQMLTSIDKGMTISKLWVMGNLGGVPDL